MLKNLVLILSLIMLGNVFAKTTVEKMEKNDVIDLLSAIHDNDVQKDFRDALDAGSIQSISVKKAQSIMKPTKTYTIDTKHCVKVGQCLGGAVLTIKSTPVVLPGHIKHVYESEVVLKK